MIVKAHSGHPRLSARTAEVAIEALTSAGAPEGVLSVVFGRENGVELVTAPGLAAVGFTGSVRGGRMLFDLAAARPDPIPFYGELGSVNPVFVTPRAEATRAGELAAGLVESFQLGLGQFCTKPGLVFTPSGGLLESEVAKALTRPASGRLLTAGIEDAFREGMSEIGEIPGVRTVAGASTQPQEFGAAAVVYAADLETVRASDALLDEHFGPTTLLVEYESIDDALALAESLGGSLTATIHSEAGEITRAMTDRLVGFAGRVLFSGWPTGVAVTWAQNHGGPWPASTSTHTSVGPTALRRFLRPVAYQSAPPELLPDELLDMNPLRIPRRIDGVLTR